MPRKAYLHVDPNPTLSAIGFAVCPAVAEFNKMRNEISKAKILYLHRTCRKMSFFSLKITVYFSPPTLLATI